MKIWDCFTFFNELELLETRLTELDPFVDAFVLVESDLTFTGLPKALYYSENRGRFERWQHKIKHVVVLDNPQTTNPWDRERHQRECLRRGFAEASPQDLVIISDVDEIPRRERMEEVVQARELRFIETLLFYHSLNLMTDTGRTWTASFIAPKHFIDTIPNFSDVRLSRCLNQSDPAGVIPLAGWHFSSIGSVAALQTKLASFSENSPDILAMNDADYLARKFANQTVFFSDEKLVVVSPTSDFPVAVQHNVEKYFKLGFLADDAGTAPRLRDILKEFYSSDLAFSRAWVMAELDQKQQTLKHQAELSSKDVKLQKAAEALHLEEQKSARLELELAAAHLQAEQNMEVLDERQREWQSKQFELEAESRNYQEQVAGLTSELENSRASVLEEKLRARRYKQELSGSVHILNRLSKRLEAAEVAVAHVERNVTNLGKKLETHVRLFGWRFRRKGSTFNALSKSVHLRVDMRMLLEAGFDEERYSAGNPDVASSGISPIKHYLLYGLSEGRDAFIKEE